MLTVKKSLVEQYTKRIAVYFPNTNPNTITILGLLFPFLFFFFLVTKQYLFALVIFPGNAFDMLDGAIARLYKKTTAFGALLDSTLDRLSDGLIISAFGFAQIVRWEIIIPLLVTSYLISYIRSRAELAAEKKISLAVGWVERTERLIFLFLALLFFILFPTFSFLSFNSAEDILILLTIFSIFTVYQRMNFAKKELSR